MTLLRIRTIMIMLRSIIREVVAKDDIKALRSNLGALREEVGARIEAL